jgi:hypothetical protein
MSRVSLYTPTDWVHDLDAATRATATENLESGRVLYFPQLAFPLQSDERALFETEW